MIVFFAQYLQMQNISTQRESALERKEWEARESLRRAQEREQQVGNILTGLFQVPQELLDRTLSADPAASAARSQDGIDQLRREFRDLAGSRAEETIRHLLTYAELRKRVDLWDVYVAENGSILFHAGGRTDEFRAETAESFEAQLYERYKALPPAKSLVVVLLSFGDAKFGVRLAAIRGLPRAVERMQSDSAGRTRFEYAVLASSPKPPLFNSD
jgi:hypothetical protein